MIKSGVGSRVMYKAILVVFFVVVCLTAFIFSNLKESIYTLM